MKYLKALIILIILQSCTTDDSRFCEIQISKPIYEQGAFNGYSDYESFKMYEDYLYNFLWSQNIRTPKEELDAELIDGVYIDTDGGYYVDMGRKVYNSKCIAICK